MQNFGVTNKEHYGMLWYFWSGQLRKRKIFFNPLQVMRYLYDKIQNHLTAEHTDKCYPS